MDTVVLRFVKPGRFNISSRLIAWFTQGSFSHVEFVTPWGTALGARLKGGVRERPLDYIGSRPCVYLEVRCVRAHEVIDRALSQVGKPYDWLAIIGFVFARNWQDTKRWFCSELCTWAFLISGVHVLRTDHVNKITPDGLALSPRLKNHNPPRIT